MTFRIRTDAEQTAIDTLRAEVEAATKRVKELKADDARKRSSLQPGDDAYCLDTGALIGKIHALIGNDYYSWIQPSIDGHLFIDNNSRTYGKPTLGTKDQATESLRRRFELLSL
jgi:hypothetical protein